VDTGCIVGFTKDVDYDIEFIGGIKKFCFERGLFTLRVLEPFTYNHYLQQVLARIIASAPSGRKQQPSEGSLWAD
jgi:hypothetical protein